MLTKTLATLVVAAGLMNGIAADAKEGKDSKSESIRLFYMPLNIATLKPVDQKRIETEGDLCVIATGPSIARLKSILVLARPARSEQEKFANQNVRIKMWLLNGAKEKLWAVVEQDGRILQNREALVLAELPLRELEEAIAAECFGGVTDPFKSAKFRRGEKLRREKLEGGQHGSE
jgi:hypothetical protein